MSTLLILHVVISLVGIFAGSVAMWALLTGRRANRWTAWFLGTTIATSLSGFVLPADRILPSHILGVLSLVTLGIAVNARYFRAQTPAWRATYGVTALVSHYFNVFVLIVQSFQKVSGLKQLAPTQTEVPFVAVQLLTLVGFAAAVTVVVARERRSRLADVDGVGANEMSAGQAGRLAGETRRLTSADAIG